MARGSIRQRSKVRQDSWTVQVYRGRDPATGKKRYYSEAVRGTKSTAEKRLTELLREMDRGTFVEPSGLTVAAFLDQWLAGECVTVLRPVTLGSYRLVVNTYIKPFLGFHRLDRLSAAHVRAMEATLLQRGVPGGRPLSGGTVRQCHKILSSALSHAVATGLLALNVAKAVSLPRVSHRETAVLDWDGLESLLREIGSDPLRWVVLLAIQTGMRRSELGGLQWGDVDFGAGVLAVRRGVVRSESGLEIGPPKSGRARVVTLPEVALETLRALREERGQVASGDFVFAGPNGFFPDVLMWTYYFKMYCRRAGLGHLRFHDLRHSHASLLLADGIHLKVVSERLGHASIGITANLYSHVLPTVQREAAERFGASWKAALGPGSAGNCV